MGGLIMYLVLAAMPANSTLVEAESFDIVSGWAPGSARAEFATNGLSGGAALNSNESSSIARKTITLPPGAYAVWVRSFDWAGAPDHYQFTMDVDGQSHSMAVSEPPFEGFYWERWGILAGGDHTVTLSQPDSFNSVVDCLLFTPDTGFIPKEGVDLTLVSAEFSGTDLSKQNRVRVTLSADTELPAPTKLLVALYSDKGTSWHTTIPITETAPWRPGVPHPLPEITIPSQPYLWPGKYALKIGLYPGTTWASGESVGELQQSSSAKPVPCSAKIVLYHDKPTLFINGKPEFAFAYLAAGGDFEKQYKQAAAAGIRFFTMGVGIGNTAEGFNSKGCDEPFLTILRQQPDALIFPRVDVTAPAWWLATHPGQAVVFEDGSTGPQSMFSQSWLDDACRWVEEYARYIRSSPYAGHVIGIHIGTGFTGEWQSWGLWDEGKGDRRGDFSEAAKAAWKAYLTKKYPSSQAMSSYWNRAIIRETAAIPTRERRESKTGFFRMPGNDQDIIDFYDFYWRGTANAIQALAAAAKRGGGRDFITGFFHGYQIQYGGKMQESQHNGIRELLNCPDIDFFCSPAMYSVREPGGTSTFMSFTESVQRHGKLWWDEADNRTHLAKDALARATDQWESLNVLKREFAHVITRQAGVWWFDMGGGWYDDPTILALFNDMRHFGETNEGAWKPKTEVAVLVDDKSSYRLAPESPYLNDNVTQFLSRMPRLGAPYDTYLLSDLPQLPDYRFYIFPDAFDLTAAESAAITALKAKKKTLLFIGPAGVGQFEGGQITHEPALSTALLGIDTTITPSQTITHDNWTLVFRRDMYPAIDELRGLVKSAGVHLYSETGDAFYAGNGLIALHAQTDGAKSLHFDTPVHLTGLFSETPLEWKGTDFDVTMNAKETRCYAVR